MEKTNESGDAPEEMLKELLQMAQSREIVQSEYSRRIDAYIQSTEEPSNPVNQALKAMLICKAEDKCSRFDQYVQAMQSHEK